MFRISLMLFSMSKARGDHCNLLPRRSLRGEFTHHTVPHAGLAARRSAADEEGAADRKGRANCEDVHCCKRGRTDGRGREGRKSRMREIAAGIFSKFNTTVQATPPTRRVFQPTSARRYKSRCARSGRSLIGAIAIAGAGWSVLIMHAFRTGRNRRRMRRPTARARAPKVLDGGELPPPIVARARREQQLIILLVGAEYGIPRVLEL